MESSKIKHKFQVSRQNLALFMMFFLENIYGLENLINFTKKKKIFLDSKSKELKIYLNLCQRRVINLEHFSVPTFSNLCK